MSTIAFLGVGSMGLPMATHAVAGGHRVRAFDPSAQQVARAAEAGAYAALDAAEAVTGADVVVIMVATGEQLLSLFDGAAAIAEHLAPAATCIVMSTVGVEAVRDVQERLQPLGVALLDAPVTGGAAGAEAATLTIFAAGTPDVVNHCRGILDVMGRVVVCGPRVGDGQAVKLVNQLLCSAHLVAAAEALAFAEALGLDPAAVLDTVSAGAAHSWMLSDRGPRMLHDDPAIRSTIDIFVKDSSLVQAAARSIGIDTSVLDAAANRFRVAAADGLGRHDDSTVIRTYRAMPAADPSTTNGRSPARNS